MTVVQIFNQLHPSHAVRISLNYSQKNFKRHCSKTEESSPHGHIVSIIPILILSSHQCLYFTS